MDAWEACEGDMATGRRMKALLRNADDCPSMDDLLTQLEEQYAGKYRFIAQYYRHISANIKIKTSFVSHKGPRVSFFLYLFKSVCNTMLCMIYQYG